MHFSLNRWFCESRIQREDVCRGACCCAVMCGTKNAANDRTVVNNILMPDTKIEGDAVMDKTVWLSASTLGTKLIVYPQIQASKHHTALNSPYAV